MSAGMNPLQESQWEHLYDELGHILERFGKDDGFGKGDYWLMDENWGIYQQKLDIQNLNLIKPDVVKLLQNKLSKFPGWEIVVSIDVPEHEADWPAMGLIIRSYEIIDGLQRQYFPAEFQDIQYEGSRRGTDRD
ncbi:MAG: hypothetical protein HY244_12080 [Rhizobiales bacterium]|nr:hypothetical protein [Hyphomicrobiales bacterium]